MLENKPSRTFSVLVIVVVLVTGTVFPVMIGAMAETESFESHSSDETIVLVKEDDEDKLEYINEYGEIIDHYGENILLEIPRQDISELRREYEVDGLESSNQINIKGHTFDTTEGFCDLDTDLKIEGYESENEGIYIVDMIGPVNPEWKEQLEDLGVDVLNYQPNYAYEVVMDPDIAEMVENFDFVDWVGPYQPEFKIHPAVDDALEKEMPFTVRLRPGFEDTTLNQIDTKLDVVSHEDLKEDGLRLTVNIDSLNKIESLAMDNDVYYISPYVEPELHGEMDIQQLGGGMWFMDDEYETRTDLDPEPPEGDPQEPYRKHGDYGAYINQLGHYGDDITVAVADSGVGDGSTGDAGVEDFTGRIIDGYGFGEENDWQDGLGHGTQVTGFIAGDTYHGTGETWDDFEDGDMEYYMGQGLASESEIFATKIFDDGGNFLPTEYYPIIEEPAQRSDAYIHGNSWGAGTMGEYSDSDEIFDQGVRDADRDTDENEEMVVTVSAGNDGGRGGYEQETGSPGNAKNVITVGGNQPYNPGLGYENPHNMADFSSRGWTEDNRIKPDIVAPSESVLSQNTPLDEGDYVAVDGTSFGNPLAAGAASIVVEWYEDNYDEKPSPAMVRAILINTANELDPEIGDTRGHVPNEDEGWGVPDLSKLEHPEKEHMDFLFEDQESLLTTGEVNEYEVSYPDDEEPLKITLAWTDEHAVEGDSAGGSPTLKNNLDLEVESPDGKIYRGNAFNETGGAESDNGFSYADTEVMEVFDHSEDGWDDANNVQNVFIPPEEIETGSYSIRVKGTNIPADSNNDGEANQDYALSVYNSPSKHIPEKDGEIIFDENEYAGDDYVNITLIDAILQDEETHDIDVSSLDSEGSEIENVTVTLYEDEENPGTFKGSLQLTEDEEGEGLFVQHDGEIKGWYWDEDPGHPDDLEEIDENRLGTNSKITETRDVGVSEINQPSERVNAEESHPVEVTVENYGTFDEPSVPVETTIATEKQLLYEDFDGEIPDDWEIDSTASETWEWDETFGGTPMASVDEAPSENQDEWLITPTFDASEAEETHLYLDQSISVTTWESSAEVSISTDGGDSWEEIDSYTSDAGEKEYDISEWADGEEEVQLAFIFESNTHDGWVTDGYDLFEVEVDYIGEVYSDEMTVDIDSDDYETVTFDEWKPSTEAVYYMNSTTSLEEDDDPTNDYETQTITVENINDVGVTEIIDPPEIVSSDETYPVEVEVENFGTFDETEIPVEVLIEGNSVDVTGEEEISLFYEDFDEEIPDDWEINDTASTTWEWDETSDDIPMASIDEESNENQDEWLITPKFDASEAQETILYLDQSVMIDNGWNTVSSAEVSISTDGGDSWEEIDTYSSDAGEKEYDISEWADGEEEVQLAFIFDSDIHSEWVSDGYDLFEVEVYYLGDDDYSDETTIDLYAGENKSVSFDDWTPSDDSEFLMNATTSLDDDDDPTNDYTTQTMELSDVLDVGVTEIHSPEGSYLFDTMIDVEAEVENFGELDIDDVPVEATIEEMVKLLDEDFEDEIPDEWTIDNTTDGSATWHHDESWDGTNMAKIQDCADTSQEEWLISPEFDASEAFDTFLEINHEFYNGIWGDSFGELKISSDAGENWETIDKMDDSDSETEELVYDISDRVEGEEEIQIALVFNAEDHGSTYSHDYWDIYDISVTYKEDAEYIDDITTDIDSESKINVTFEDWEPDNVGEYKVNVTTLLEHDADPSNDYETQFVEILEREHDIGVDDILTPKSLTWNETQTVTSNITNYGDYHETDIPIEANAQRILGIREDFSGDFPPKGWETDDWIQSYSNEAGGEAPEAELYWENIEDDYSYLKSEPVDTNDTEELTLEFKSHIDHYEEYFSARVLVRSDLDEDWSDVSPWNNPVFGDIEADEYEVNITEYIGEETQLKFEFEGDAWNINHWYIDDIRADYIEDGYEYEDEIEIDLDMGETKTTEFEDWNPSTPGDYVFNVTAQHPDESHPENSSFEKDIYVEEVIYDLEATSINRPIEPVFNYEEEVIGTVTNVGNRDITEETVVNMDIKPVHRNMPINEEFSDGLPDGWTIEDRDGNDNTWEWDEEDELMKVTSANEHENDVLWTEVADCSIEDIGEDHRLELEFLSTYQGTNDRDLLISTDGGETYRRIGRDIGEGEMTHDITDIALDEEEVMIGWEFYSEEPEEEDYWKIDDVKISHEYTTEEYFSSATFDDLNVSEEKQLSFENWDPEYYPSEYILTMTTDHEEDENLENVEIVERLKVEEHAPPEPPIDPNPEDGEEDVTHSPVLDVLVTDPNDHHMDVTFYLFDEDGDEIANETDKNVDSGERAEVQFLMIDVDSTFTWHVEADDGIESTSSQTWEFHTYEPEGMWKTTTADINTESPGQVENIEVDWDNDIWSVTGNEVSWDASPDDGAGNDDTEYYSIYRAEDEEGPWDETTKIGTVEADGSENYSYFDEGMADDGEQWSYVVRAVDRVGNMDMNEESVSEMPLPDVTDPNPIDGEEVEELEQTLSVDITTPNHIEEMMEVRFYDGRTHELIAREDGVDENPVEVTWELEESDMGEDHYWFVVGGYEDYDVSKMSPESLFEKEIGTTSDEDIQVAVIDEENYHNGEIENKLEDYLPSEYTVDTLESYEVIENMDEYDEFVIQRFGSDSLAEDFLDSLEDDQGVVYLDSHQGATAEGYSDGIYRLHNVRNDPEFRNSEGGDTDPPTTMNILEDHPIFDKVGEAGEDITLFDGMNNWGSWFDDYSGDLLAEVDYGGGFSGPGVGVSQDDSEILLPAKGIDVFGEADDEGWTEEANQLLANSVEFVAGQAEYEPEGWHFHLLNTVDPVADAGEDIEADQGDMITLDGTDSYNPPSENGGIDAYEWTIEDPTGDVTELQGALVEYTLEYALEYEVTLTVYDEEGNQDEDTIQIYAVDTEDPIADAGEDIEAYQGESVTLDGSGSTDNVGIDEYEWTIDKPTGEEITQYGEQVDYTLEYALEYEVTLTVYDEEGNQDEDTIQIYAVDTEDPIADAGEDIEAYQGESVTLDGSGSTDNVGIDEYEWTIDKPTGEEITQYGEQVDYTLEYALEYEVTLTVYDEEGNQDEDTIQIYAVDTEDPIADAGTSDRTRVGMEYTLDGSNSTDNIGIVDYEWTITGISEEAEGYEEILHGETVDITFLYHGLYEIELKVSDAEDNSDMDKITLTVDPSLEAFDITSPAEDYDTIEEETVTVEWEGHEYLEDLSYEVRLNYGDWHEIGSETDYTFVGLEDGTHAVQVRATDELDNSYTETRIFVIDTIEEDLEIISPEDGVENLTYDEDFTIIGETDSMLDVYINGEFVSVDDDGGFEYSTTLIEGQNVFRIEAQNEGETVAEMKVFALYLPQIPEIQDDIDYLEDEIAINRDAIDDLEDVTDQLEIDISDLEDDLHAEIDELENALEENVSALEDAIDENKTELIDIIEDNIDELEGEIDDINDEINYIHDELDDLSALIADLEDEIAVNKDAIDDLEDVTDQLDIDISDLEDELHLEVNELEVALNENVSTLEDAIGENRTDLIDIIDDNISEIEDEIDDIHYEIDEIYDDLDDIVGTMADLEDEIAVNKDAIDDLEDVTAQLEIDISDLEDELHLEVNELEVALNENVSALENVIEENADDIDLIQDDITEIESNIVSLDDNVTEIEYEIMVIDNELSSLNEDVEDVESETRSKIEDLEADLESQINDLDLLVNELEDDLEQQIDYLEKDIDLELDDLESELKEEIDEIRDSIEELELENEELEDELKAQIDGIEVGLQEEINDVENKLEEELDSLDADIEDTEDDSNLARNLGIVGTILAVLALIVGIVLNSDKKLEK